jgi:hypothetical protein
MFIDSPLHLGDVGNQMHAKIIGTNESTPAQVQSNEIVHFASSRGINETTTNLISIDSELQVEVVIEAPPCSASHHTHTHYTMANIFSKTYHMVVEHVFNTFSSNALCPKFLINFNIQFQ